MTDTTTIAAALAPLGLSLRPFAAADMQFLYRVYAETRTEELAITGWNEAQQQAFLAMQFEAQHRYYQQNYADAAFQIIALAGQPIGRLYLVRLPGELRVIDIALLAAYRGRGLGSAILTAILDAGRGLGLPVRIHVERFNPARRLYTRLGFRQIDDTGVYYLMEWAPDAR